MSGSTSKTFARNTTVEGTTYPAGTKLSSLPEDEQKLVTNPKVFAEAEEIEASVGAGLYDDGKVWTKAKLQDELDKRNAERDDDNQVAPAGDKRDDLVAILEQLDASTPV